MKRVLDVKFNVLRDGAVFSEIFPVGMPALRMSSNGDIKAALAGEFLDNPSVNWLTDTVQPVLIVDGQTSPLGVFLPAAVQRKETETTKSIELELYDRCWQVKDSLTETHIRLNAGANYVDLVQTLLVEAGVTLVQATPTAATLAEDREDWDVGTSRLEIINQLLAEINYNSLWFNSDGAAIVEPVTVPTAANIKHILDGKDIKSLLRPQMSTELDFYNAPNVFICVCSNADKSAPLVATAVNDNPQSPLSIPRRGRRIAQVTKVDNIADLDALQEFANIQRNNSMMGAEVIEIETALHPGYGAFDVTAINYGEISGICAETAWEMALKTGGTMKHTLKKVVYALE